MLSAIEGLTDETVSALLIVLMFVVAFTCGVIAMFQVEQETRYLVSASGKVFDDVLEAHPEFYEWLPEAKDFKEHFQTGLNSAYVYARDWTIGAVSAVKTPPYPYPILSILVFPVGSIDHFGYQ